MAIKAILTNISFYGLLKKKSYGFETTCFSSSLWDSNKTMACDLKKKPIFTLELYPKWCAIHYALTHYVLNSVVYTFCKVIFFKFYFILLYVVTWIGMHLRIQHSFHVTWYPSLYLHTLGEMNTDLRCWYWNSFFMYTENHIGTCTQT